MLLLSLAAGGAPEAEPTVEPSWVLGSDSPRAGEISDAWLVLPAALGSPAGPARAEILAPAGLEAWIRRGGETCLAARPRAIRVWEGRIASDEMVPVCLRASRPQKLRLVARVRLPVGTPAPIVRVVAANAIEVQPRFRSGETLLAVLSAILGFLAGVVTHWIEKRGEVKAARRKAEAEIETVLTRGLAAEVLRNVLQLRGYLESPKNRPANLQTPGGALLFDESLGALAYLSEPDRLVFLRKFKNLYKHFNLYNRAVDGGQDEEARAAAQDALKLVDSSLQEFVGGSSKGVTL